MRKIKAKFDALRERTGIWSYRFRSRGVSRLHQRPAWEVTGFFAVIPSWAPTASAIGFLVLAAGYGIALGGHARDVSESVTSAAGFAVNEITMEGLQRVTEFQVLEALELQERPSLLLFDAGEAKDRLEDIAWIRSASIQKFFPGTLRVLIKEQEPYVLWQRGDITSVITKKGEVITDEVDGRYANLLRVVNHGAQLRASEIMSELNKFPGIRARVRAAQLRSERRWDLAMENGITVRLPEFDVGDALAELKKLDEQGALLSRDIVAVDLRLQDRVVVRLSDDAALRRQTTIEQRTNPSRTGRDT
ncbi:Cell division protein FtsQ [Pseudovibrio axinellae]|uniref:Cell division protein FtsQ n=1 Tax=Pseudovibrio axinellae TaxID=989403 RepID=A0A161XHT2_9HYPH|nr:cell division protein FtsQ/DivIB [Pseudovibrio axinellae]KZL21483.1 Cell division protein FtsQ [Pseudovibrio axinellae]SER06770.1 cell division protein FtsQ [Pseudovibrio axinellae]